MHDAIRRSLCAATVLLPLAAPRAQPTAPATGLRGLQIVVPTPPGAQPDTLARWLAEPLAQRAGIPVVVLNRPGAAGAVAVDAVLAAPPESGSLLLGGLDHVAYSHVGNGRRPLDPFVDLTPVAAVNRDTWLLVCATSLPIERLADLVDDARRDAGSSYASGGEGSTAHLLSARLAKRLGFAATHVPYKDSWLPDLLTGRIRFAIAPTPTVIGQVRAGKLRALASLTTERLSTLDTVPSIAELGHPDQVFLGGLFLFAPAVLARSASTLNDWMLETLRRPEIVARYRDAGIETAPLDLGQTRASVTERLAIVDAMRVAVFGRAR